LSSPKDWLQRFIKNYLYLFYFIMNKRPDFTFGLLSSQHTS